MTKQKPDLSQLCKFIKKETEKMTSHKSSYPFKSPKKSKNPIIFLD